MNGCLKPKSKKTQDEISAMSVIVWQSRVAFTVGVQHRESFSMFVLAEELQNCYTD